MEEEKPESKFVKDKELVVTKIELESNPNVKDEIKRIRFKTNRGDITWKAKVEQVEMIRGMEFKEMVPITKNNIPTVVLEMNEVINTQGSAKYIAQYGILKSKDGEGDEVTYRFITAESILKKWELVKTKVKQETVSDATKIEKAYNKTPTAEEIKANEDADKVVETLIATEKAAKESNGGKK